MVDGVIEEQEILFVTIFTKMYFWFFVNYILLFSMGTLDRYILQTGSQCFTMHFLLLGPAYSHLFLKEMQTKNARLKIPYSTKLDLNICISILKFSGYGWLRLSFMVLFVSLFHFSAFKTLKTLVGSVLTTGL